MTTSLSQDTVVLDRDRIADMERVIDTVLPAGPAAGVPLGYLSAITPFDQPVLAGLHTELAMPYATTAADHVSTVRTLSPGERLTATLSYDGVQVRQRASGGRLALATFRRTFAERDGAAVAVVRWVCALMDQPAVAGSATAEQPVPPPRSLPLRPDLAARWAQWSGDHEPIHLDPAVARAAGLPGPVAHASLVTAMTDRLVRQAVPGAAVRSIQIRHRGGVFAGDTVGLALAGAGEFRLLSERGAVATVSVSGSSEVPITKRGTP